jgi:hypothetical protein
MAYSHNYKFIKEDRTYSTQNCYIDTAPELILLAAEKLTGHPVLFFGKPHCANKNTSEIMARTCASS